MDASGFSTGTFILNILVGLFCLYLFYKAGVKLLLEKSGWQTVSSYVNVALIAMIWLLAFGPSGLSDNSGLGARIGWIVAVTIFGLLALWNMLWVTFTKKDYPPLAPIAYGITLGGYACLFIVFVFYKTTFNFS